MSKLESYWHGKTVLITGASSGLGWAVTEALAPYGVHFALLSRREEKMRELVEQLRDTPSRFWFRSVDVRNRDEASVRSHASKPRNPIAARFSRGLPESRGNSSQ